MIDGSDRALGHSIPLIFVPVFLLICGMLSYIASRPPSPLGPQADPSVFSAARAAQILQTIASRPHPIGSSAHDEVRDFVFGQLRPLVDDLAVQRTEVVSNYHPRQSVVPMASVENLVARVRGRESHGALVLMSHYDSAPSSPGAADDGSGVAAILETLRALRAGERLRNDLIVFVSDGEEAGLLGAQAFFREHPWRDDVRLVLNFEARGTSGPVILFETSPGNGHLIAEFSRSVPHPMANSLAYEAYKRMPNDTDLSIAIRGGHAGLNFAFTEGFYDYHTAGDSLDHLSRRSLQQVGETALALSRRFGNLDLENLRTPDTGYFNPVGSWLIRYPMWIPPALSVLFIGLFLWGVIRNSRIRQGSIGSVALGATLFLAVLILFCDVAAILLGLVRRLADSDGLGQWKLLMAPRAVPAGEFLVGIAVVVLIVEWIRRGVQLWQAVVLGVLLVVGAWSSGPFSPPLAVLDGALALYFFLAFRRSRRDAWSFSLGALGVWIVGFVLLAVLLPGAAFPLGWPLIFLLPVYVWMAGRPEDFPGRRGGWPAIFLAAFPGCLLLIEIALVVHVNLVSLLPWIAALPAGLILGLLLPLFFAAGSRGRWLTAVAAALVGMVLLMVPVFSSFDTRHRRPSELFFLVEQDLQQGHWATTDGNLSSWQRRVMGTTTRTSVDRILPGRSGGLLLSEPYPVQIQAPEFEPIAYVETNRGESAEFRLKPAPGAARLHLLFLGVEGLLAASVKCRSVADPRGSSAVRHWIYSAPPPEGLDVRLEARSLSAATFRVVQIAYGWPERPQPSARPPDEMPNPWGLADSTLIVRDWKLADSKH